MGRGTISLSLGDCQAETPWKPRFLPCFLHWEPPQSFPSPSSRIFHGSQSGNGRGLRTERTHPDETPLLISARLRQRSWLGLNPGRAPKRVELKEIFRSSRTSGGRTFSSWAFETACQKHRIQAQKPVAQAWNAPVLSGDSFRRGRERARVNRSSA